ncbi:MAG: protein phosphatase 2C domain-containing protein [Nannocystaceae bacterium]
MRLIAWPATDVGRVRSHNEDSHLVDNAMGLYLVADGMGGHAGGAHASQLCVDVVDKVVRRGTDALAMVTPEHRTAAIADLLTIAASEASARIFDQANSDHRLQGMGTTLTGMLIYGERGYIVHVGDSRAFLLRGGTCRQLTNDHSWLNEQVQAGMLTEEEAAASDLKHIITRSVGFERHVEPDVIPVNVNLGDAFLLCSDGFSNYVEAEEIAVLARDHWYADLPRVCTEYANKRGGDDNITVLLVLACNDRDERRPMPQYRRTVLETLPPGTSA